MKPTLPFIGLTRQMTKCLALFALVFTGFGFNQGIAQTLFNYTNDSLGLYNSIAPAHMTATSVTPGMAIKHDNYPPCGPTDGLGTDGWPSTNVFDFHVFNANGWYVTFTLTPDVGYGLKVTGFSARSRRENLTGTVDDGPLALRYGYSTDGGMSWTTVNPGNPQSSNLCASGGVNRVWPSWADVLSNTPIMFRIYGLSSGTSGKGDLFLRDIVVNGEVCANAPSITLDWMSSDLNACSGETTASLAYSATDASSYSINYDLAAEAQGFVDFASPSLPGAPGALSLVVPAGAAAGTYNAILTVSNACGFTTNYPFTVQVWALPTVAVSGDQTICFGNFAAINVAYTGASPWNVQLSDGSSYNAVSGNVIGGLQPGSTTTYTVTALTDANGCAAIPAGLTGSATVTVNPLPDAYITTSASVICQGGTVDATFHETDYPVGTTFTIYLTADDDNSPYPVIFTGVENGDVFTWTEGSEFEGTLYLYDITVVVEGSPACESPMSPVTINVNNNPDISASNSTICSGASTAMNVSNPNGVVGSTFNWTAVYNGVTGGSGGASAVAFGPNAINETLVNNTNAPIDVIYTLQAFGPAPTNCAGDAILVTVTVEPQPTFGFSAATTSNPTESGNNTSGPSTISIDFCAGDLMTLSGYSDNGNVGYIVSYTTSGNVSYGGGGPLPLSSGPDYASATPSNAATFFGSVYGGYGLTSGTFGNITQTFVPYLDINNNNAYDLGTDCLGSPMTLVYNIYGPIVVTVTRNANNLCSGEQVDYTISTNASQNVLFDLTLAENAGGGNPADLDDDNTLPVVLTGLSMNSASPYHFLQVINNGAGLFDRGRVSFSVTNVHYANANVCAATVNNANPNTTVYPEPRLAAPVDKVICTGSGTNLDIDLDPSSLPSSNPANAGFDVGVNWTVSAINNVAGASNFNSNLTIHTSGGGDVSNLDINQVLTLVNPAVPGSVTYTITPRSMGPGGGYNGNDCFGDPITIIVTVVPPSVPEITGPSCVHVNASMQLSGADNVVFPASVASTTWSDDGSGHATVDQDGFVTGHSIGSSVIYYTVTDNVGCVSTASYTVQVLGPVTLTQSTDDSPVGCGDLMQVCVSVANFCDINGLAFSVNWDDSKFEFVSASAAGLPDMEFTYPGTNGDLDAAWFGDPTGLMDGTNIICYTLRAIGSTGSDDLSLSDPIASNSSYSLVDVDPGSPLTVVIAPLSFVLGPNPVICPSETTTTLNYCGVVGNPNHYNIQFDQAAINAGFPVADGGTLVPDLMGCGQIIIDIPSGLPHGNYHATITISNTVTGCESIAYPFDIVVDQTPPTASNPAPITQACFPAPAPNPNVVIDEADNCPGAISVVWLNDSDNGGTGCGLNAKVITRTYRVTDAAGNTTDVTQTITIQDNVAPFLENPPALATWYPTEADGLAAALAHANLNKRDNCTPTAAIVAMQGSAPSYLGCSVTYHIILKDACNNAANFDYTTVIDGAAPVATAGPIDDCYDQSEDTQNPYFPYEYAVTAAIEATEATDDCDEDLDYSASWSGYDCDLAIVVTVTDNCGKTASVTYHTRADNDAPTIFPYNTLALEGDCFTTEEDARDAAIAATAANDDCLGDLQYDAFVNPGCPADIMVVVTDYCGNPSTITYTGVYIDVEDPQLGLAEEVYPVCFTNKDDAVAALADALNPTDNCSTEAELIASAVGVWNGSDPCDQSVVITFKDHCGRTVTSDPITGITIDDENPTQVTPMPTLAFVCHDEATASEPDPQSVATYVTDNCGVADIQWVEELDDIPSTCPGQGSRTYRVFDCAGNTLDVVQPITINDNVPPTFFAPNNITLSYECSDEDILYALQFEPVNDETHTYNEDNCGEVSVVLESETTLQDCAHSIVRTWRAYDQCGNSSTDVFTLTIQILDSNAPVWTSGYFDEGYYYSVQVECSDEAGLQDAFEYQPEAYDHCSDVTYQMDGDPVFNYNQECVDGYIGYWTTIWYATDACGNESEPFYYYINIYDNTAPVWETAAGALDAAIACDDIQAFEYYNSLEPAAVDNCDESLNIQKTLGSFVAGSCPQTGTITNVWTASDDCGNVSEEYHQVITLIDNQPPIFDPNCQFMPLNLYTSEGYQCPSTAGITGLTVGQIISESTVWNVAGFDVPPLGGCIYDNCAPSSAINVEVVSIDNVYNSANCSRTITLSFRLSDPCGNVQPNLFVCVYNIIDDVAPGVSAGSIAACYHTQADAEAAAIAATSAVDDCTLSGDLQFSATTMDDCAASIEVTVRDCAGNANSVTYSTRIDGTGPVLTEGTIQHCYPDIPTAEAAAKAATQRSDNCPGGMSISASTSGTCPAQITVTVTDGCGNSSSVVYGDNGFDICIGQSTLLTITVPASSTSTNCESETNALNAWIAVHGGAQANDPNATWSYSPVVYGPVDCMTHSKTASVTFTATNACGYTATTTANFTVTDNVPPTANSIANTNLTCSTGIPGPDVNNVVGEADNCSVPTVTLFSTSDNMAAGCPGAPRIVIYQYKVTDAYCNSITVNQMITVVDNVAPTFTAPANITINENSGCSYNASVAATGDVTNESDNCTPVGAGLQATFTDVVTPGQAGQNPKFVITRTWTLSDACGNTAIPRTQIITVNDVTPPTIGGCPANITQAGGTVITEGNTYNCAWTAAGLNAPGIGDNCGNPTLSYTLSGFFVGASSGTGSINGRVFLEGTTTVTYIATDQVGNTVSCSFTITVNCLTISGRIVWEHDDVSGVKDATVRLSQGPTQLGSDLSDTNGDYDLTAPAAGLYRVTPVKNINRFNGVTSMDATIITNHVNGVTLITDPYKKVCADVNHNGTITLQDATLITQALAGNPVALAAFNVFWRFAPSDYVMPATAPSVTPAFPEFKDVTVAAADVTGVNFVGMKIGDVNGSGNPQNAPVISPLVWMLQDKTLTADEVLEVAFTANNFNDLAAYQFALDFDPTQLQYVGFESTGALPLSLDNFGAFNANIGELRTAWAIGNGATLSDGTPVFKVKFKVLASGRKLSEVLNLDNAAMDCKAFSSALLSTDVKLVYTESVDTHLPLDPGHLQLQLLQNRPNPFTDATTIGFILPESCKAQIRILDISGRELAVYDRDYSAGYHELEFRMENAASYGVLFCELVTPQGKRVMKMMAAK